MLEMTSTLFCWWLRKVPMGSWGLSYRNCCIMDAKWNILPTQKPYHDYVIMVGHITFILVYQCIAFENFFWPKFHLCILYWNRDDWVDIPEDLKTMSKRVESEQYYVTFEMFFADVRRMFSNARTYNSPETIYYKCASRHGALIPVS